MIDRDDAARHDAERRPNEMTVELDPDEAARKWCTTNVPNLD